MTMLKYQKRIFYNKKMASSQNRCVHSRTPCLYLKHAPPFSNLTSVQIKSVMCKLTLFRGLFLLLRNKIAWKQVRAGKILSHGGKFCRKGGNLLFFRDFSSLNSNFQLFRKKKSVFEHFHLWLFLDKSVSLHIIIGLFEAN